MVDTQGQCRVLKVSAVYGLILFRTCSCAVYRLWPAVEGYQLNDDAISHE